MDISLQRVVGALNELAEVGLLWEKGLLNPGGPHRRLRGHHYPISIGEDECLVFGKLVEALRPETATSSATRSASRRRTSPT